MKAAYVQRLDGPAALVLGEMPEPHAGPGELRIQVKAAGIGPWDVKAIEGRFGERPLPFVVGFEFAGVVDEVGAGVEGFSVGDEVFGTDRHAGSFAEYRLVSPADTGHKPAKMTFEEAVALVVAGTTALEGIIERLAIQPGETLLVTAATGGVGTVAVQIGKDAGAQVFALAGPTNQEFARALGAQHVFDYTDEHWPEKVRRVAPDGVDALFDGAGGKTLERALETVKDGGRAVGIVFAGPKEAPRGISLERFSAASGAERINRLARMADEGRLKVELAAELPLDQAEDALERVAGGHTRGKVVIKL